MSEVTLQINGRKYRMACEDGQEQHLIGLGERFNKFTDGFKDDFGEIGDNRLTVMAGIAVMDSLVELEKKFSKLQEKYNELDEATGVISSDNEDLEYEYAKRMNEVAQKIEHLSDALQGLKT